jgi:hypothetical protein
VIDTRVTNTADFMYNTKAMPEIINTYLLTDPETALPMNRDDFYAEQIAAFKKDGKPTRANDVVQVFLFRSNGELLV